MGANDCSIEDACSTHAGVMSNEKAADRLEKSAKPSDDIVSHSNIAREAKRPLKTVTRAL